MIVRASVYTEPEARGLQVGATAGKGARMACTRPSAGATCARENLKFSFFPSFFFTSNSAETSGVPVRH